MVNSAVVRSLLARCGLLLIAVAAGVPVHAQSDPIAGWPNRPIKLILPTAAGGAGDIVSRLVTQKLGERLGQQFVIENRPGGNGIIGSAAIANAAPDGYTIGLVTASTHAAAPAIGQNIPFDAIKDFAPISLMGNLPIVLAVHPGLPIKNLAEFVALAKTRPREINNAWGAAMPYLAALLFCKEAGIELNHIPYKGSGQAAVDLIEGRIQAQFGTVSPILALIKDGKLRALAVTSSQRTAALPDVPTVAEVLLPGFGSSLWLALAAPAGTPERIIRRLNEEMAAILKDPAMQKAFADRGVDPEFGPPEQLAERIREDIEKFRGVVAQTGARPEL
jgi:tripartite-type tricarboxylate transporter receptor subunit TctC